MKYLKNSLKISTICFVLMIFNALFADAQSEYVKIQKLGFVSELSYIKSTSETHFLKYVGDSTRIDAERVEMILKYQSLKSLYDQIILQLVSDCISKNNIKNFTEIDNAFILYKPEAIKTTSKDQLLKNFMTSIKVANSNFNEFIAFVPKSKTAGTPSIVNSFSGTPMALSLTNGLYVVTETSEVSSMQNNLDKVQALTSVLKELRFSEVKNLMAMEK